MKNEPVGIGALVVALTNSVLAAGTLLGVWSLTADQVAGLNLVVVNVVLLVTALLTRRKVSPVGGGGG